ncbi:serine hydrolase domain-containing protein, partial [Enterococcus faecium]|uniref:serine hydrolase domain-containing protein n=1 Tax=Enterococcus faecium TaxID=1352 RepID=UPI003AAE9A0D
MNFKTKEPILPTTPFHLASISKTFTAVTVLHLMEQGRISLEDPVYKYLSGFPYTSITIKNLLSHRSGLPKYDHFMSGTRAIVTRRKNRRGKWVKRTSYITDPISVT